MGWSKLNVDGSSRRNLLGACGVIRSDQGSWVIGFTKFIGIGNIELAEAWSLYLGLKIASSLHIKSVEIETDCQRIHTLLTEEEKTFHPLCTIISNCRHILSTFDHKVLKISKLQKCCADLLAKEGRKSKLPLRTFSDPPLLFCQHSMKTCRDLRHFWIPFSLPAFFLSLFFFLTCIIMLT